MLRCCASNEVEQRVYVVRTNYLLNSRTLQSHLLGVFENVNRVEFHEKDYDKMLSVVSKEGETIMV